MGGDITICMYPPPTYVTFCHKFWVPSPPLYPSDVIVECFNMYFDKRGEVNLKFLKMLYSLRSNFLVFEKIDTVHLTTVHELELKKWVFGSGEWTKYNIDF